MFQQYLGVSTDENSSDATRCECIGDKSRPDRALWAIEKTWTSVSEIGMKNDVEHFKAEFSFDLISIFKCLLLQVYKIDWLS